MTLPKNATIEAADVDFEVHLIGEDSKSSNAGFLTLKKSHFDLSIRAKGKAELYFHSYFWTSYIDNLAATCGAEKASTEIPEITRMRSLATRP